MVKLTKQQNIGTFQNGLLTEFFVFCFISSFPHPSGIVRSSVLRADSAEQEELLKFSSRRICFHRFLRVSQLLLHHHPTSPDPPDQGGTLKSSPAVQQYGKSFLTCLPFAPWPSLPAGFRTVNQIQCFCFLLKTRTTACVIQM